jgi:hypothetical protein
MSNNYEGTEVYTIAMIEKGRQIWFIDNNNVGFLTEESRIELGLPVLSIGDTVELLRNAKGFYTSGSVLKNESISRNP